MFLRFTITSFIILCSIGINAQRDSKIVSPIKVGAIPGVELFRRLNIYDVMYDSLKKSMNQEFQTEAKKYSDSLQFLQKQVDSIYLVHFKTPTTMMRSLNRSRYELVNFQNGSLQQDIQDQETLRDIGTYCSCQLAKDTIKIVMGIDVMGGFIISLRVVGNYFSGNYYLDENRLKVLKLNIADTLVDVTTVPFAKQNLLLEKKIIWKAGQQLTGYLSFITKPYFRSAQYNPGLAQDDYSDKKMDTMITKARIHFTCNVYDNPAYKEYFDFLNLFTPQ